MKYGMILVGIFIIIWFAFMITVLTAVLGSSTKYYKAKSRERKAYENMIMAPTDTSVSHYIQIFLQTSTYTVSNSQNYNNLNKNLEDRYRQAQGYLVIKANPNVSDQVKEQLRKAFVSKGVPIK